jgi:hypothetical protein
VFLSCPSLVTALNASLFLARLADLDLVLM